MRAKSVKRRPKPISIGHPVYFAQFLKLAELKPPTRWGALAGAAEGGTKLAGLAQKVKDVGGLDGVVAKASRGANSAAQGAGSALASAESWLSDALGIKGPEVAAVGMGKLDARTSPTSVCPLGSGARADGASSASGSATLEQRAVLSGRDPNTLTGLKANAVYELSGGYRYVTDEQGRVTEIHATLRNQPGERTKHCRARPAVSRDCKPTRAVILSPCASTVLRTKSSQPCRRGSKRSCRCQAKELDQGTQVDVKMKLTYPKDSQRPSEIRVQSQVDGGDPSVQLFCK